MNAKLEMMQILRMWDKVAPTKTGIYYPDGAHPVMDMMLYQVQALGLSFKFPRLLMELLQRGSGNNRTIALIMVYLMTKASAERSDDIMWPGYIFTREDWADAFGDEIPDWSDSRRPWEIMHKIAEPLVLPPKIQIDNSLLLNRPYFWYSTIRRDIPYTFLDDMRWTEADQKETEIMYAVMPNDEE